jgi:hypothetical protein
MRTDSVVETKLADVEQGFRIGSPLSTSSLDLIRECDIDWPGNTMKYRHHNHDLIHAAFIGHSAF